MNKVVFQSIGLTKRYADLVAVNDLNLEIYAGEVCGLLGPNGAGKTTAINMLCGLLRPDVGDVLLNGVPISGISINQRGWVGVCPQDIVIWDRLTCLEQLLFVCRMYNLPDKTAFDRAHSLLVTLNLAEKANRQGRTLSGGMKRRLNLALALVHDPEILVLDEPEVGLDPQSRILVRDYLHTLAHKKTIILTTHNMDEAERLADRVAIIDHGKLLVMDTPDALKRHVGEGDVIELDFASLSQATRAVTVLSDSFPHLHPNVVDKTLTARSLEIVGFLPQIVAILSAADLKPDEVRIRSNTLEDVFIHLTGRRLRE